MATMLDCKKIQPLLSEYVDGTLGSEKAWDVKMHVSSCAVCGQVAQELSATASLLSALPSLEPSANFEAMLAKRLANQVLTPQKPSLRERIATSLSDLWARPLVRPALATGVAMAAMLPVAMLITKPTGTPVAQNGSPVPAPTAMVNSTAAPTEGKDTKDAAPLDQLWRDHVSYASSEPLGNSAAILTASSNSSNDL